MKLDAGPFMQGTQNTLEAQAFPQAQALLPIPVTHAHTHSNSCCTSHAHAAPCSHLHTPAACAALCFPAVMGFQPIGSLQVRRARVVVHAA
eukprot:scaffold271397_cov19-Tisochrysis_lutea.AAC.1